MTYNRSPFNTYLPVNIPFVPTLSIIFILVLDHARLTPQPQAHSNRIWVEIEQKALLALPSLFRKGIH